MPSPVSTYDVMPGPVVTISAKLPGPPVLRSIEKPSSSRDCSAHERVSWAAVASRAHAIRTPAARTRTGTTRIQIWGVRREALTRGRCGAASGLQGRAGVGGCQGVRSTARPTHACQIDRCVRVPASTAQGPSAAGSRRPRADGQRDVGSVRLRRPAGESPGAKAANRVPAMAVLSRWSIRAGSLQVESHRLEAARRVHGRSYIGVRKSYMKVQ